MRLCLFLSLITLCIAGCAATSETADSANEASSSPALPSVTTDVVYGHKDGMALTLDVYQPSDPNGSAVISIESGGWRSSWGMLHQFVETPDGLRPMTIDEIGEVGGFLPAHNYAGLLANGFTVFSVRHGSSPRYPMPEIVADMRRAVRFVRYYAGEYSVDADRLGVWGGSAGGHLSLVLGTTAQPPVAEPSEDLESESTRVAAVVAYFPPSDLERFGTSQMQAVFPAIVLGVEEAAEYSPIRSVSADDAPTLILHGDVDELVPILEGETMYQALSEAGVASEFITVEGSGHGFNGDAAVMANAAMVDWFEQHLN